MTKGKNQYVVQTKDGQGIQLQDSNGTNKKAIKE